MATVTTITLVDDLDESPADETIVFGFDGTRYEIDLNAKHAGELRGLFAPYIKGGRKAPHGSGRRTPPSRSARVVTRGAAYAEGVTTAQVRAWARGEGIDLADRGRISDDVMDRYRAAHSGG